ncbi:zinc finger protein 276 [Alosa sapidissima]|uniref:zinc finger protein 276 n=1 Tax=Alosa sapidissima TaxID=34773 RepID=UPI001C09E283|nr:zinc finger protein 276 [Alosa sapidissima]
MKRTQRRTRASESSPQTSQKQTGGRKRPVRRGKPRKFQNFEVSSSSASDRSFQEDFDEEGANARGCGTEISTPNKHSKTATKQKGNGRLSTAFCRLCHGKFSKRRLRHAFDKQLEEGMEVDDFLDRENHEAPLLFCTDFQRLIGVPMNRDPRLSSFICKTCHAQFYKCHRILTDFRRRVNHTPTSHEGNRDRGSESVPAIEGCISTTSITSDPKCLHSLVSWAHHHAEACHSCPNLREVLEDQCWGSVKAVWGCIDGHSYVMDTNGTQPMVNPGHGPDAGEQPSRDSSHRPKIPRKPSNASTTTNSTVQPSPATTPQIQHCNQGDFSPSTDGLFPNDKIPSPVAAQPMAQTADSDLSDRNFSSDEEYADGRKGALSDEQADPYPPKRSAPTKRRTTTKAAKPPPQPKERKKPGPKKKQKSEKEELPTIYKCPYQGCTAVYRGSDGMKKHIKEHHEEVRERPCPHPGCNKVFMIDRYLQRHVKLIHTEERNYICDQCGQTFKQRKHLSVHQMRHSGAKPLQCEVCGFQCRQRASLKYHMTKHKAEADLEFACMLCGKRFEKAHNLNVHMSMVHPLTQGGSNDTPTPGNPSDLDRSRQSTRSTETPQAQPIQELDTGSATQDAQRTTLASPDMSYMLENL